MGDPHDELPDDLVAAQAEIVALRTQLAATRSQLEQVEQARREWTALSDDLSDPIFIHDHDYRLVRVNRAYVERAGQPLESILGRPYWEVWPRLDGPTRLCSALTQTGDTGNETLELPGGEVFRSRSHAIRDAQGNYLHSLHILEEITEHHRLQVHLKTLARALEHAVEGVVVTDEALRVRFVNRALTRLLGHTEQEIDNRDLLSLLPGLPPHREGEIRDACAAGNEWVGETSLASDTHAGAVALLALSPIIDAQGIQRGHLGVFNDLKAVHHHEMRWRSLVEVIEAIALGTSFKAVAEQALQSVVGMTSTQVGIITLRNEGEETPHIHLWHGPHHEFRNEPLLTPFSAQSGATGRAYYESRTVTVEDYQTFPQAVPLFAKIGVTSLIAIPINADNETLGVLTIATIGERRDFSANERRLLEAVARQLGGVLQRERLLTRLRASEEQQRNLIASIPGIIYRLNPENSRVLYVSPAIEEFLGFQREEWVADSGLWEASLHPDDREGLMARIKESMLRTGNFKEEYRLRRKGEEGYRWFQDHGRLVTSPSGERQVIGMLSDITRVKESELAQRAERKRAQRYLDVARVMIVALDTAGRITLINRRGCELLGYDEGELIGCDWFDRFIAPRELPAVRATFDEIVRDSHVHTQAINAVRTRDGSLRIVSWNSVPLHDENGTLLGTLSSGEDITDRDRAEHELARRSDELEKRVKELRAIYLIAREVAQLKGDIDTFLARVMEHLSSAFHDPRRTRFMIRLEAWEHASKGFRDDPHNLRIPIRLHGDEIGLITLNLRPDKGDDAPPPPLPEEHELLRTVAHLIAEGVGRHRAEQALQERSDFLEAILEDIPLLICRWRRDGTITFVNRHYCNYFGKSQEELVGHNFMPPVPDEDHVLIKNHIDALSADTPLDQIEHRVIAGGGEVRWQRWIDRILLNADGQVHEYQSIGEDITERRRIEEALTWELGVNQALAHVARAFLEQDTLSLADFSHLVLQLAQKLTESTLGFVGYIDPTSGHLIIPTLTGAVWERCAVEGKSAVFERWGGLFGWVLDHREALLCNDVAADPRSTGVPAGHLPIHKFLSAPALSGQQLVGQIALANPAGEYREEDLALIRHMAELYAVAVRHKWDQEALQESESRLHNLIEELGDGVLVLDSDLNILFANPAAIGLLGRPHEELLHKPFGFPVIGSALTEVEIIVPGRTPVTCELRVGDIRWQSELGLLVLLHDVTARKAMETGMRNLAETLELSVESRTHDLEEANRELLIEIAKRERLEQQLHRTIEDLQAFTSSVAHDVRAPLRAILGFSELLEAQHAERLGDTGRDYLRRIEASTRQMDTLTHDLLDYTRLTRAELMVEPVALAPLLADVARELRGEIERHGATVQGALEGRVMAHTTTLGQILTNLIGNALKFVPEQRHPEVTVSGEGRGDHLRITISDNGIGIQGEYLERIFNPFERLHDQAEYPGSGIGLAIVRTGIQRMGGRFGVDSTPGKGSRFWIELPIAAEEVQGP